MRTLEQGTVLFSRYKITDLIGSGGTSHVYLAENVKVGTKVAVKVVSKERSAADLIGEKELLKELRHSAIPIILDIEEDEENLYLVEEYVEGRVLTSLKQQLGEEEMIAIMLQLCDVLNYLHRVSETPIIYRDMKPDNVILMADGRLKLIDFGIAIQYSDDSKEHKAHYGTRGYAAPEQLSYAKSDEKTDIYAMGVTVYYMLTGKNLSQPPYRLKPIREVNPEVSVAFGAIISKCIETLPAKRYQNVAQVMYDLKAMREEDQGEKDFHTFKTQSKKIITIAGIRRGMGTTHMAFMLGNYYRLQNKTVAIIEWQKRDDLLRMAAYHPDMAEERYRYTYRGMDCYFHISGCDYSKALDRFYDVVIVDAGTCSEMMDKGSYEVSDEVLILCGTKDWELDFFEDMTYTDSAERARYLFNFTDDETFARLLKDFPGNSLYQLPYNPKPEAVSEATLQAISEMMQEIGPAPKPKREGVLSRVKNYLETQFERLT